MHKSMRINQMQSESLENLDSKVWMSCEKYRAQS